MPITGISLILGYGGGSLHVQTTFFCFIRPTTADIQKLGKLWGLITSAQTADLSVLKNKNIGPAKKKNIRDLKQSLETNLLGFTYSMLLLSSGKLVKSVKSVAILTLWP